MHLDVARELKARILDRLPAGAQASSTAGPGRTDWPGIAVGLTPAPAGARVAVRLQRAGDAALLPDLGRAAAAEVDVRVIGPVRALSAPGLRTRVRPLRPGLSVAHPRSTAGTLGGFVRTASGLALLSNNHVLALSNHGVVGDAVLQPGVADGGSAGDRVATLAAFEPMPSSAAGLVDAAVATLDDGVSAEPAQLPGGALLGSVPESLDVDPDEPVEKIGRTTGRTLGRITAVEVDAVAVQYDQAVHRFDDQIEIEGRTGAFSAGGSLIWRSRDRAPIGLLFAGSSTGGTAGSGVTFANPLSTVLAVLAVELVTG